MSKEFNPDAILCLSSRDRIAIKLNRTGEAVRYQLSGYKLSRWCKIYYNQKGEPYFKARRRRFYLSQFHFAIIPPYNSIDMAITHRKVVNNNKNYLIIVADFFPAICEHCSSYIPYLTVPSAFYIAKTDKWLCRDCMRKWFERAKANEISDREKQNFEYVKQKLGL